jgi:hypothetical protein
MPEADPTQISLLLLVVSSSVPSFSKRATLNDVPFLVNV